MKKIQKKKIQKIFKLKKNNLKFKKMDGLEEIRKRKLEGLKKVYQDQTQQQSNEEEQLQQQIQQLEVIVKQALTKEALERYGNFKAAFPDRAIQLLAILAQAIQSGQISKIDDDTLKDILKKIRPEKKDIKIRRV